MQVNNKRTEKGVFAVEQTESSEVAVAQRAKMQQTHAVRHRQYTFEEKSRRSYCPDRKQSICRIEREQQKQTKKRIHVNKTSIKRKTNGQMERKYAVERCTCYKQTQGSCMMGYMYLTPLLVTASPLI